MNKADIQKKLETITIEQAKDICMKHCSEYVFQTKIAA